MQFALIGVHILACAILVLVVLLQTGKGASLGAAFGGASQTVFGSRGAQTFLGKLTTGVAVVFMLTSLTLSVGALSTGSTSLMQDAVEQEQPKAPVTAPAVEQPAAAEATATQAAPAQAAATEEAPAQATQAAPAEPAAKATAAPAAEQAPAKAPAPAEDSKK